MASRPGNHHGNYFSCCITTITRPITSKLGKVVTYYNKLQLYKSRNPFNKWTRESRDKLKHFISTNTIPMVTKPGRVVTYNKELPSIKSHVAFITWSS